MEYVFELPFGAVTVIETAVLAPTPLSGMVACPVGILVPALTEPEITAFASAFVADTFMLMTSLATSVV